MRVFCISILLSIGLLLRHAPVAHHTLIMTEPVTRPALASNGHECNAGGAPNSLSKDDYGQLTRPRTACVLWRAWASFASTAPIVGRGKEKSAHGSKSSGAPFG